MVHCVRLQDSIIGGVHNGNKHYVIENLQSFLAFVCHWFGCVWTNRVSLHTKDFVQSTRVLRQHALCSIVGAAWWLIVEREEKRDKVLNLKSITDDFIFRMPWYGNQQYWHKY